ncbi:MAG: helix-turn-helix domain-containing protein [Saprospiraceae bacterium]
MDKILSEFGKKVKSIRVAKGLSQEQLSAITDLDRSYLSDIERGLRNVSLKNIEVLASAFEVPIYQMFLADGNILENWQIKVSDLESLILENPSLRGFVIGYLAEAKLREMIASDKRISGFKKFDDHDRSNKHDLLVTYKGKNFSIETKSLQTNTVRKISDSEYEGRFQCDASDKRTIRLASGEAITTTCLRYSDFDVLAVNLFAFRGRWEFAFALNRDLPPSNYSKYPEEIRQNLIKSIIPISLPLQPPFESDLFTVLERLHR